MRTVIVVDPEKEGSITRMVAQSEPQTGENVLLITELFGEPIGAGTVQNVRPYPNWVGRFLYDVKVTSKQTNRTRKVIVK